MAKDIDGAKILLIQRQVSAAQAHAAKCVCYLGYLAYILVGLGLCAIAVTYTVNIEGAHVYITVITFFAGLSMIGIGAFALWSMCQVQWINLVAVQVGNFIVFATVACMALVGVMLAMDVRDPVRKAVETSWEDSEWQGGFYDSKYCQTSVVALCGKKFVAAAEAAIADEYSLYPDGTRPNDLFQNCTMAVDLASRDTSGGLGNTCESCKNNCKEALIGDIHNQLSPALLVIICLLGFVWCVTFWLLTVAYDEPGMTPLAVKIITHVLLAIVGAMGIALAVLAYLGTQELTKDCPPGGDCTNNAIWISIGVGIGLFVATFVTALAVCTNKKTMIKIMAAVFVMFSTILFMSSLFLSIVAGAMETINTEAEMNFPELRAQYEQKDPAYCTKTDDNKESDTFGEEISMKNPECRKKIKMDIEEQLAPVAGYGVMVCMGMMLVMFYTFRVIKVLGVEAGMAKGLLKPADERDEDDKEGGEDNPAKKQENE